MLEVLVAFVVLVAIFALIYKMVMFSSNLRMKAIDTETVFNSFNQEIYKTGDYDDSEISVVPITRNSSDGPVFYITVDTETTNVQLNVTNGGEASVSEAKDKLDNVRLGLYRFKAIKYESTNSLVNEEGVIAPKVLVFKYEK